jgi:hypothetical protein
LWVVNLSRLKSITIVICSYVFECGDGAILIKFAGILHICILSNRDAFLCDKVYMHLFDEGATGKMMC